MSGVAAQLREEWGGNIIVKGAMRYGQPSIASQTRALFEEGVQQLIVASALSSVWWPRPLRQRLMRIRRASRGQRWLPDLRFVSSYHDHPAYITAVADSIRQHWESHGRADKLVLSYHGMPKVSLGRRPLSLSVHEDLSLVAAELGLEEHEYMSTFQSRFGRDEWLKPYTDETLQGLPEQGVKSLQIICPGFSADCLETIEEIGMENRDYFIEAGGERYEYIRLNATPQHIDVLTQLVKEQLVGWKAPKYDLR